MGGSTASGTVPNAAVLKSAGLGTPLACPKASTIL